MMLNSYISSRVKMEKQEELLQVDFPVIASPAPKRRFIEFPSPRSSSVSSLNTKNQSQDAWQTEFDRTIDSIRAKHGPIDKDCTLETDHMRKVTMFGIWGLLNELQNKKLDEIDMNSLELYYKVAGDAEKLNIKMKWLLNRLDEIKEAILSKNEAEFLQAQKNKHVKEREVKEEQLRELQIKLKEIQMQVKEMESSVTGEDLVIVELDGDINNLASKFEHFQTRPLLDGLI